MLDTVVLSTNDNPNYKNMWTVVRKAWKLCFPNIKIKLAYVTDAPDMMMSHHEDVFIFPLVPGIPSANLAKVARWFLAGFQGNSICMVNDIDLIPLTNEYIKKILNYRTPNHFLCVGCDIYENTPDAGKFPSGYFTAESNLIKELWNPKELTWLNYVNQFIGLKVFDNKEDITNPLQTSNPDCFSDESLMRVMLSRYPDQTKIQRIAHCMGSLENNRIDGARYKCDIYRLKAHSYFEAHALRPISKFQKEIDFLMEYMVKKYG